MRSLFALVSFIASAALVGCADPDQPPPAPASSEVASPLDPAGGVAWVGFTAGTIRTQHNSTGAANAVAHVGTGLYDVTYPLLGGDGGNVQAASGDPAGERTCNPVSWYPSGTSQIVRIACKSLYGGLVDGDFETLFFRGGSATKAAYLWADQPAAPSYAPAAPYAWSAYVGTPNVTRNAPGDYTVKVRNGSDAKGHVQLSSYGSNDRLCKVTGWSGNVYSNSTTTIGVRCFDLANGALADAQFSVLFLIDPPFGTDTTWAWAFTSGGAYTLPAAWKRGLVTTASPLDSQMTMGGGQGLVLTTTYGANPQSCFQRNFFPAGGNMHFQVKCVPGPGAPPGAAVNAPFTVLHLFRP